MSGGVAAAETGAVTRVTARVVAVDVGREVRTPVGSFAVQHYVVVTVEAGGTAGDAYGWTFHAPEAAIVRDMTAYLGSLLIGRPAADIGAAWTAMDQALRLTGRAGVGMFGLSLLDTALWDLAGRAHGLPLWRLLGADVPSRMPCYASQALFLTSTRAMLAEEAGRLRDEGYATVKMRVGLADRAEDLRRVETVRDALGDGIDLMADAVLAWDAATAGRMLRALEPFDLAWLEDPVDYHEGLRPEPLARLRREGRVPLAAGEFLYTAAAHQALLDARAVDYLIVDLQRVGGVTGWRDVAAQARAAGVPLAAHVFPELALHLYGSSVPLATPIEFLPWSTQLSRRPLRPRDGHLPRPEEPGVGLCLDWRRIEERTVGEVREVAGNG